MYRWRSEGIVGTCGRNAGIGREEGEVGRRWLGEVLGEQGGEKWIKEIEEEGKMLGEREEGNDEEERRKEREADRGRRGRERKEGK